MFFFERVWRVRDNAYGKDVVLQYRAVTDILVNFRQRASQNGITISSLREDVSHGGTKRLYWWLVLGRLQDSLAAQNVFRTGVFVFTILYIYIIAAGA